VADGWRSVSEITDQWRDAPVHPIERTAFRAQGSPVTNPYRDLYDLVHAPNRRRRRERARARDDG
jgi:hypothetical protein